jgi:putative ABC transport system permease protein
VVARLRPGTDVAALSARMEEDQRVPAAVQTERDYLASMSEVMSAILLTLGGILATIMGIAAVFTATNTMLSALATRVHEVGILLSIGYRPLPIFFSFLLEAAVLGVLGGLLGSLITLPLHGVETGTTNFNTFTEVAVAFRITPEVLLTAALFSLLLGLFGGAWPAWRAARMTPTEALRRQ